MMQINIVEYLEKTVLKCRQKQAVIDGARSINFEELARRSKVLATKIINRLGCLNTPVAVFLEKSIESVVADVAITYSGNIYMNLDTKNPDIRLQNICNKIKPAIIITNGAGAKRLQEILPEVKTINVDEVDWNDNFDQSVIFKRLENLIDTDPYAIINTSGSTGTPKGVVLNHKSFIDFTEWSKDVLHMNESEIIGSLSPLYFDIYSYELCLLMAQSATLVILPEQLAIFPARLIELLEAQNVNYIFWVPTIMVNIANLDILSSFGLKSLSKIWFAGEVFPTKHLNYWRKHLPGATFVNLYGPIEITLDCTYYIVDKEFSNDTPIPIGYPCRNTDVLILNEDNKPAAVNEKGELCIRGTSLAMGYYNDPEKTAKAFTQNPLNNSYPELIYRTGDVVFKNAAGEIIFAGRKDFQIKHLGYRIDLGEVEHVIVNNFGQINNACVLYNFDKKEICLFYETDQPLVAADFRKGLLKFLPKYMIPSQFYKFDKLPRNPNGKIDRNLLTQQLKNGVS